MGEAIVASWAKCMRDLFVDTARGAALDRIAFDRFGVTRKPASAATVDINLHRTSAAAGGGTVAAGTRLTTASGSVFAVEVDVVFGPTDLSKNAPSVAQVVGPSMNVPAGTAWVISDSLFDPSIVATNSTNPAAGGSDAESDAQFRGRIRSYFLTLRRATVGAIQYAATTIPGVSVSSAYEIVNPGNALPAGAVELIIGDDDGNASSDMLQSVRDILLQFRACGIPVFLSGGDVAFESVVYKLGFAPGVDTIRAANEVRSVVVAMAQFLNPGQRLLRSDLIGAARSVPGVVVADDALVAPVGDIIPDDNQQLLRVRPEDVSFT